MSQPTYSYDAQCHDDAAQAIRAADDAIRTELRNLDIFAMNHMAEWISRVSREQYNEHKAKWDAAVNKMNEILETAGPVLLNIKNNYDHHDHRVQKSFSN